MRKQGQRKQGRGSQKELGPVTPLLEMPVHLWDDKPTSLIQDPKSLAPELACICLC